jgi:[pyruvate, water dikinase]-phosphate phosphotransferase / [pyruvate, water dikinase] kinase
LAQKSQQALVRRALSTDDLVSPMLTVFVVSDATGDTAQRMVGAALVQFKEAPVRLVRRAHVRTPRQVHAVVHEARGREAIIIHTMVSDELRHVMRAEARTHGVDTLDIMGPILERLTTHLKLAPQEKPGLFKDLTEAKTREIEAVSFAFRHDDGQNSQDLERAEVVLVGISRTMKTPTMLYMAYRGWFAANVPLVPGLSPPKSLLAMPADRVFCLVMTPEKLQQLRRVRAEEESIPLQSYASLEQIRSELAYVEKLCRKHHWQRIDTTGKSVEEAAREIIGWLEE